MIYRRRIDPRPVIMWYIACYRQRIPIGLETLVAMYARAPETFDGEKDELIASHRPSK